MPIEASLSSPKQIVHFTNTLEHAMMSLESIVNEHIFMNLVPLDQNSSLT